MRRLVAACAAVNPTSRRRNQAVLVRSGMPRFSERSRASRVPGAATGGAGAWHQDGAAHALTVASWAVRVRSGPPGVMPDTGGDVVPGPASGRRPAIRAPGARGPLVADAARGPGVWRDPGPRHRAVGPMAHP